MTTERRSGAAAEITLTVGSVVMELDAAAGRSDLATSHPLRSTPRSLPGGVQVVIPLTIRDGRISCAVLRTIDTDRLCGLNQRRGTLQIRSAGTGTGLPQRSIAVVVSTTLILTGGGLGAWRITMTIAGAATDTVQS